MPLHPIPPDILLPSEQRRREIESRLMFGRRTVWSVYGAVFLLLGGLFLRGQFHRTALIAPIDPTFHAAMVGIGVFFGVLLAAVEYDGWQLGIGKDRSGRTPTGFAALLGMAGAIGLCGLGGSYVAGQLVEWHAFHGLVPASSDVDFIVDGRSSSRTGETLELRAAQDGTRIWMPCGGEMYRALSVGDHIVLPVQTGRGGIRRAVLPALADLRRS